MPRPATLLRSLLTSTVRAWRGTQVLRAATAPAQLLVVFDRENDPDCRLLRELLTELQLDALIQPCPLGGRRYARKLPPGAALPCLIDASHSHQGLRDCVQHLLDHYAHVGWAGSTLASWPMQLSSRLASRLSRGAGEHARPSRAAKKPLELYSFESSPYARLVRERLCELELPWILRSFGKEQLSDWGPPALRLSLRPWRPRPGGRRAAMLQQTGKAQVPYLIDPNHGVSLFESDRILDHLERHYAR